MENKGGFDKVLDRILDVFYSKDKIKLYLLGILLLGLVLRIIAAINLTVTADDMHHVLHAINFFSSGKLTTYDQSAGLWHSFTSIMYSIFGIGQVTSRLASIIFGSFSILAVYLLSKEFFNEKVALVAALILALSPFHIKNTYGEMDVTVIFFILMSAYFFVRSLKLNKKLPFALSGLFMGLAIYTKVYALLFIPAFICFAIYYNHKTHKKIITEKIISKFIIFLVIIFLFCIPVLAHNYLLYKDKGIADFIFTNTLGIAKEKGAQYYSWDAGWQKQHNWMGLIFGGDPNYKYPLAIEGLNFILFSDPLTFILGLVGLIYGFYKKKDYSWLFIFIFIFVFPYLASIILLPKHYVFLSVFLAPLAAYALVGLTEKIKTKYPKVKLKYLLVVLLLFTLVYLGRSDGVSINHFYGQSAIGQAIEFKNAHIDSNTLLIVDSRMYRGRVYWIGYGKSFLEGAEFLQAYSQQDKIAGTEVPMQVIFMECVPDDCGWGTIKDQPDLNQSMEQLVSLFKQQGQLIETIKEPDNKKAYYPFISSDKLTPQINIYAGTINLKQGFLDLGRKPRNWFLYNIGYVPEGSSFDDYSLPYTSLNLIDKLAHLVRLIAVILAFLSPLYLIYLVIKEQ